MLLPVTLLPPCSETLECRFYTLRAIHNITEGVQAAGLTTPGDTLGLDAVTQNPAEAYRLSP